MLTIYLLFIKEGQKLKKNYVSKWTFFGMQVIKLSSKRSLWSSLKEFARLYKLDRLEKD